MIYVLTAFRREVRTLAPTGWARVVRAFTGQEEALEAYRAQVAQALELSGEDPARLEVELRASTAEVTAYRLDGLPLTELVASVINSPPTGDPLGASGTWWSQATMIASWWGGSEVQRAAS